MIWIVGHSVSVQGYNTNKATIQTTVGKSTNGIIKMQVTEAAELWHAATAVGDGRCMGFEQIQNTMYIEKAPTKCDGEQQPPMASSKEHEMASINQAAMAC